MSELIVHNARIATCDAARSGLGLIDHGTFAIDQGRITWVGQTGDRPRDSRRELDARGRLVTPGLIDCHTHAIYAGDRANSHAAG